jgi:hypothetical protein
VGESLKALIEAAGSVHLSNLPLHIAAIADPGEIIQQADSPEA